MTYTCSYYHNHTCVYVILKCKELNASINLRVFNKLLCTFDLQAMITIIPSQTQYVLLYSSNIGSYLRTAAARNVFLFYSVVSQI